jgi:hypothetical protein
LAATTEGALSIVVASESWGMAFRELGEKVDGLTFFGASASVLNARRVNEEEEDEDR